MPPTSTLDVAMSISVSEGAENWYLHTPTRFHDVLPEPSADTGSLRAYARHRYLSDYGAANNIIG